MKTLWARITMELDVTDEEYKALKERADRHGDVDLTDEEAQRFIDKGRVSNDSYIPDGYFDYMDEVI